MNQLNQFNFTAQLIPIRLVTRYIFYRTAKYETLHHTIFILFIR